MRRLLVFAILLAACGPVTASAPASSWAPSPIVQDGPWPDPALGAATRPHQLGCYGSCPTAPPTPPAVAPPAPRQVPTPAVMLKRGEFPVGVAPALRRVPLAELGPMYLDGWAVELMAFLDSARGLGPRVRPGSIPTDEEWQWRIWPGPFQKVARAAVAARPAQGRFFHFESIAIDAAYGLPWGGIQFVDVTLNFRDHAEDPPAEGELWYVWHLRLPTSGGSANTIADGYDGVSATAWMNSAPYWARPALENEATSAIAGYLWSESYVPDGTQQFANVRDTTPFWHARIEAMNELNRLFAAGTLTERRFEAVSVRIDRFEPLTYFGGGVVTVTVAGTLIEIVSGETSRTSFTEPMKFFRFGSNAQQLSGWTAVDAFQDGEWVSGGDLALGELTTTHG